MTTFDLGAGARCDLEKLVDTRLLIQANSGGGKSWCLRRILEQTHGKIQQLVIDPEGEFSTLRERGDYVLAARQHGDTIADPRSAKLLAERLLELGVSAIIDIYELKAHDRVRFVRLFLEALVDAPKRLWHPALVVVDEVHVYCPQAGEAESAGAVIDLATRGRKRGFAAVLATQRLSKLHKDAAAECNNKLIGRTGLDVDVKRAADELGFGKERWREMRELEPGSFFAFGPALTREVQLVHVGPVSTTHPKAGSRIAFTPPAPTAKIKALLPQLADLPAEAEERAKSMEDARKEIATLKRQVTLLERGAPAAPAREKIVEKRVEIPVLKEGQLGRFEKVMGGLPDRLNAAIAPALTVPERITAAVDPVVTVCREIAQALGKIAGNGHAGYSRNIPVSAPVSRVTPSAAPRSPVPAARAVRPPAEPAEGLTGVAQRILDALAELEQLGAESPARELVAFLAGYTHLNSKGFTNAIGSLRTAGYVDYRPGGQVILTETGHEVARFPESPRSPAEVQARVISMLGGASGKILQPLIDAYPGAMAKSEVAAAAGYGHLNSKGFTNAIGRLRTLGFVQYPTPGQVVASPVLFLEPA